VGGLGKKTAKARTNYGATEEPLVMALNSVYQTTYPRHHTNGMIE
jgi:hypothetical protein